MPDRHPYQDFKKELGVVTKLHDSGCVDVTLCSGALLFQVVPESLASVQLNGDEPECERLAMISSTMVQGTSEAKHKVYAPPSPTAIETAQTQAKAVKELLVKWSARAALVPGWSRSFWTGVGDLGKPEPRVDALLKTHGYFGQGAGTPPRVADLKDKLLELESRGALAHSTVLFDKGLLDVAEENFNPDEDHGGWEASLAP